MCRSPLGYGNIATAQRFSLGEVSCARKGSRSSHTGSHLASVPWTSYVACSSRSLICSFSRFAGFGPGMKKPSAREGSRIVVAMRLGKEELEPHAGMIPANGDAPGTLGTSVTPPALRADFPLTVGLTTRPRFSRLL